MAPRLRVGIISYGAHQPHSGIRRYTTEVVRALAAGGRVEPVVLATDPDDPLVAIYEHALLPASRRLPGLLTVGALALPGLAQRMGLAVLHDLAGVCPFPRPQAGLRTVVTVHDAGPWVAPELHPRLNRWLHRWWLPRALRRMDLVVTDSDSARRELAAFLHLDPERLAVVYPGVTRLLPLSEREARAVARRLGVEGPFILWVGVAEPKKNLATLLTAYERLGGLPHRLVLAGPRAQAYASHSRVLALLPVSDAELGGLYRAADLFVFPSSHEGFGLPPLEAMAVGTPVVAARAGALPEVLGGAALLVDPRDPAALARAMERALTDEGLAGRLRERGRRRAARYRWEETAARLTELYLRLAAGERALSSATDSPSRRGAAATTVR